MVLVKRYTAFTLAEVLITLGVIGIVAAMTIPTLMNKTQDMEYKTAYKKAYSTISQAFLSASNDGNIVSLTGTTSSQGMEANFAALKSYFTVTKSCTDSLGYGCWNPSGELWRAESYSTPGFIDASGMEWKLRNSDAANITPVILVDTNGNKTPNQYGKDRFILFFNNSSGTDPWTTAANGIGMPTKISPFYDILAPETNGVFQTMCPSYLTHACYYTSWIMQ